MTAVGVSVGSVVGGFRVETPLDRGGMGVVYRATQLSLGRVVALKVVAPELAGDTTFRDRFLREAHIAASIAHPHLLPVYDAGEVDGVLFLAMRLVEGVSLAELLAQEGRLEAGRAAGLMAQVAGALERAHRAGLVHRDVKPANILIEGDVGAEHAYLCDFGLSRRVASVSALTRPEGFVGSAAYAAPEQIRGALVDGRTDVYALGCVLFECLVGRRPFPHVDELALMWAHMHEAPPVPSSLDPSLAAFDEIVARALAKEPTERPSAAEFMVLLGGPHAGSYVPAVVPPRSASTNRLPVPATSFLGRARELGEVVELLLRDDVRLLTLTGPGGTGKTRLALRAAEEAAPAFADGVLWVGLASLGDPGLVASALAEVLEVKEQPNRELLDVLSERLAGKRMLVLLDNAEHLLPALAETAAQLRASGGPLLLVTSRERLQVAGEHVYAVPELNASESVELFVTRAAAAGVAVETTSAVEQLCAKLEHLPLALELAAARTVLFTPAQLLDRLGQRLDLLKGGRDADPRQETLRATIEWSFELLNPAEQRLFQALSVFAGGCTYDAAEHVAGADPDTLQSLIDKSLLRRRETFLGPRYWMLETIREFALERLRDGNDTEPHLRHARFYLELAARSEEDAHANRAELFDVVEAERANIGAAVKSFVAAGEGDDARRLVGSLWPFWFFRGRLREGLSLVTAALAAAPEGDPELRVNALWGGAKFSLLLGDVDGGAATAGELLELGERYGLARGVAIATELLAMVEQWRGNLEAARRLYGRSLRLARDSPDLFLLASVSNNFGDLELGDGNFEAAGRLFEESLTVGRGLRDGHRISTALCNLGFARHLVGATEAARSHFVESLRSAAALDYGEGVAYALLGIALSEEPRRGLMLVGAADAAFAELERVIQPFEQGLREQVVTTGEAAMGAEACRRALERGRGMAIDDVVALALGPETTPLEVREPSVALVETRSSTNLPRPASSFVGRERELADVLARFERGARLVTLTGPGGTGKTRLALQVATSLVPGYRAGVFWVGLASLRDPALVVESIAQTLGAKGDVAEHIGVQELLLLLDNLEQVIDAAPKLAALLRACPNLRLLVTSRELLRVEGEVEYAVPPLADPEAIALFCERAQTEPTVQIGELCAGLDNLPLAVELAAARTKALTPYQILERIAQRLDLLKGGRDADPRQQTLRATIEWSYDLLTSEEQALFARLAVFVGGCTLEAADAVAGAGVDTLQSLVEKSLLRFTNERYWMLETIREYASERLQQADDRERLRHRHAEHYLELAERLTPFEHEPLRRGGTRLLADEHANLRASLAWFHDARRSDDELRLVCALYDFWNVRGHYYEGRSFVEAALENNVPQSPALRAKALAVASDFVRILGAVDQARTYSEESLSLSRQLGDDEGVARALHELGEAASYEENYDGAVELFEEAVNISRRVGHDGAGSVGNLGFIALLQGDYERAAPLCAEAISLFRQRGVMSGVIVGLANLADAELGLGQLDEARVHLAECLELAREARFLELIAAGLETAATLLLETGDTETAARLTGAGDALVDEIDFVLHPADRRRRERLRADLRALLATSVEELRDEGRRLSVDDASTLALEALSTTPGTV